MRVRLFVLIGTIVAVGAATSAWQQPAPAAGRGAAAAAGAPPQGAGAQDAIPGGPTIPGQNLAGMHVYIRGGLKTHGEGLHDYPQFMADWSKFLTERGAVVDGSFHAPTAVELEKVDVILMYKGDAGYMTDREKADLEAFVKRGGGVVSLHDALCGPDPEWWANTVTGGAKKHGERNFSQGMLHTTIIDKANPIMEGLTDFDMQEEAFMLMTWAKNPQIHPLATVAMPNGDHKDEVVPQVWTYEHTLAGGKPARAFVWMQGHGYKNYSDPQVRTMLLRGIAWAGKRPVNELVDYKAPPARGGRGGGGQ
jgi:type 1 glutamine amidotransferase